MSAAPGSVTVTSVTPAGDPDWEVESVTPAKGALTRADFKAVLNKTFGPGRWVPAPGGGGYRTPAQEDALRRSGAGTVPKGQVSAHSEGDEDDPGAFDFQVPGMSQKEAAAKLAKADNRFSKVFAESAKGGQGEHVHAEVALKGGDDPWAVASVEPVKTTAAQPKPKGNAYTRQVEKREGQNVADLQATIADVKAHPKNPVNALKVLGAVGNYATTQVGAAGAAAEDVIARPLVEGYNKLTGQHANVEGTVDLVNNAIGGAVGASEGPAALQGDRNALEATARAMREAAPGESAAQAPDALRAARVARLRAAGVDVTGGQAKGGQPRRIEEALQSHPLVGNAFREQQDRSILSFNQATYDKALAPIGEKAPRTIPPGRDGVAYVERRISNAYDQILPQVSVKVDRPFMQDLAQIDRASQKLGPAQKAQFDAIVKQDVLTHFGTGDTVDGQTFKKVESDLSRQSRNFKSSPDPNQREAGHMLDDVLDVLRDGAERSSAPGVRDRLRKVNEAFATFTRVQDASTRRASSGGIFTPNDLVQAVKKGDRTVRKGAFARGDALLQGFADDASAILPNRLPNNGTADRLRLTSKEGLVEAAVSPVTNSLARAALNRSAAQRAASRTPANYLRGVDSRVSPLVRHAVIGTNALKAVSQQQP